MLKRRKREERGNSSNTERNQLNQGRVSIHSGWVKTGRKNILKLRNECGLGRWAKWLDGQFSKCGSVHGPQVSIGGVHDDKNDCHIIIRH